MITKIGKRHQYTMFDEYRAALDEGHRQTVDRHEHKMGRYEAASHLDYLNKFHPEQRDALYNPKFPELGTVGDKLKRDYKQFNELLEGDAKWQAIARHKAKKLRKEIRSGALQQRIAQTQAEAAAKAQAEAAAKAQAEAAAKAQAEANAHAYADKVLAPAKEQITNLNNQIDDFAKKINSGESFTEAVNKGIANANKGVSTAASNMAESATQAASKAAPVSRFGRNLGIAGATAALATPALYYLYNRNRNQ